MRRVLVLAALAAACLSVLAGVASANVIQKCVPNVRPGVEVTNGTRYRLFCGSARAIVHAGGVTSMRSNGACYRVPGSMTVGLGRLAITGSKPDSPAFYLNVGATGDGTYRIGVVELQSKRNALNASKVKVVISGKLTRGTFSGKFQNGPTFTGSFTCK
jgi:hypothetical protein